MSPSRFALQFTVAVLLAILSAPATAHAVGPDPVPLWPKGAPDAQGTDESDTPTIRVYLPESAQATGAGVVICPGGGYGILAMDHEGHQLAKWFNRIGVAGFVLRYRHAPKYRHPIPLQDAQRAIRYVRANAEKFGVSPHRLGIMGFSAGGHLASTVATRFDRGQPDASDAVDRQSCRPDFAILCYPVINLVENFGHKGSARNLLGPEPDAKVLESLCNDKQVTKETPPIFLFHTAEDPGVPVENSLAFFAACRKAGVPAELHVYQDGPHGVGLAPGDAAVNGWKDRLHDWLRSSAFLADVKRAAVSGTITVAGKPLRWGMITFVPDNPNAPRGWAMVSNGNFQIPASRGAQLGTNRIELRNMGAVEPRPTLEDVDVLNTSALVIDITDKDNVFTINLQ